MDLSQGSIPNFDGAPTLQGFDFNNIQDGQRVKGSGRQYVRFYPMKVAVAVAKEFKQDPKTGSTTVTKREIEERVIEMVEIITPGDKNEINVMAEDWHRREFARQYLNYRNGKGIVDGLSVDDCDYITGNVATELKHLGCHTQEQLAEASDTLCALVPNGDSLRSMAQAMVKVEFDNRNLGRTNILEKKLKEQELEMEQMKAQLAALTERKGKEK